VLKELDNLLSQKDKRILFVGIGNLLKSDDGAGVYISKRIKNSERIFTLTVEVSIENYIGKINRIDPDFLILIDCVNMNMPSGTCKIVDVSQIADMTFNTHNISLRRLSEFFNMEVFILGIQPLNIDFGENISYLVKAVADRIIKQINKKEVHHGSRISM
jgi:hydrogenase 3 maturation protease